VTTEADANGVAVIPDLVQRDFTTDCPGTTLVGDTTCIHTWHGFIYQSTAIDCSAKKVVGWSVADHVRTSLVGNALRYGAATTLIAPGATSH
jgi:transposase InsO family protein